MLDDATIEHTCQAARCPVIVVTFAPAHKLTASLHCTPASSRHVSPFSTVAFLLCFYPPRPLPPPPSPGCQFPWPSTHLCLQLSVLGSSSSLRPKPTVAASRLRPATSLNPEAWSHAQPQLTDLTRSTQGAACLGLSHHTRRRPGSSGPI